MAVRRKLIRRIAAEVLANNGVSAPSVPVEQIVRALGAELRSERAEPSLSGFLIRDVERNRAVIGVNSAHPPVRRRFTIAHEIGHLLLHEGERVHVDHTDRMFQIMRRDEESSLGTNVVEQEANFFAAELLMPDSFIIRDFAEREHLDVEDEQAMRALGKRYGVSVQALTFRLAYLGYRAPG